MKWLLEETNRNSAYIRKQGFNLVECWECEWCELKKANMQELVTIYSDSASSTLGQSEDNDARNNSRRCKT